MTDSQHIARREQPGQLARPTALIDSFKLLDVYAGGVSEEAPRTEVLATISAGERVYNTPDGRPGAADKFGRPQRSKPIRLSDGTWAGRIILHDRMGHAPGLARALEKGEHGRLTIAFPFDDPSQFIKCRFMNYSTSQLLAHGDEKSLMVLGQRGYFKVLAGTPEYAQEVAKCKVSVSVYFCLAEWADRGSEVVFPDGVGAYYRLRFTSRHSLRSILAGLRSIGQFTQGAIAGVPFELMIDFREVAGSDGKKRTIPVWTIATRPPEMFRLTSRNFLSVMGNALEQGKALMLPAPPEPSLDQALDDGPDTDLDDSTVEGVVVEPTDAQLDMAARGGGCDVKYWNRMWHLTVKRSRLEDDAARADFIREYTNGETGSLPIALEGMTEKQVQAFMLHVTETLNGEREARDARGEPTPARPTEPPRGGRGYNDLFPDDEEDLSPAPTEASEPYAPITAPESVNTRETPESTALASSAPSETTLPRPVEGQEHSWAEWEAMYWAHAARLHQLDTSFDPLTAGEVKKLANKRIQEAVRSVIGQADSIEEGFRLAEEETDETTDAE